MSFLPCNKKEENNQFSILLYSFTFLCIVMVLDSPRLYVELQAYTMKVLFLNMKSILFNLLVHDFKGNIMI